MACWLGGSELHWDKTGGSELHWEKTSERGNGCVGEMRCRARSCPEQREALGYKPVRLGDRPVMKDRAVGPDDRGPAEWSAPRQEDTLEVFPAALSNQVQLLAAMRDLDDRAAGGGEGAIRSFVQCRSGVAAEPDQGQSGA